MVDDVLLNKASAIERSVRRAREEYAAAGGSFASDFTRQDAAILNIQRACESALDIALYLVRREGLGVPQSARDAFALLFRSGWIAPQVAERMGRMTGFRNVAVHDYQALQLPITINVIEHRLDDFFDFTRQVLEREQAAAAGRDASTR